MKGKAIKNYSARELDKLATDLSDIKPMSAVMRRKWESAKRTGKRVRQRTPGGHSQKASLATSRIVPVSLDSNLLSEADRYARDAGISRSRLVAEALRLRMNQVAG